MSASDKLSFDGQGVFEIVSSTTWLQVTLCDFWNVTKLCQRKGLLDETGGKLLVGESEITHQACQSWI